MDIITYKLAQKYADQVAAGFSSVTVDGMKIIFTLNDGKTATVTVPAPKDGEDGVSITNVTLNNQSHLICTLSDGSTIDAGLVRQGVDGKDGVDGNGISSIEKTKTEGLVDTYTIYFTDGTTTTFTVTNGSGGSGTDDYTDLTNKPTINNVELSGNKTSSDLGLQPAGNYVTNTDYATPNVGGVIKVANGDYGLTVDEGALKGTVRTVSQYESMSSKGLVCKGTLENVLADKKYQNALIIDASDPSQWQDDQPTQAILEDVMSNDYNVLNIINAVNIPNIEAWFAEEEENEDHGETTRIKKYYFFTDKSDGSNNNIILQIIEISKTDNDPAEMTFLDKLMATKDEIPTKTSDLVNDSGFINGLTTLSYGHSTWDDFMTAYRNHQVVYCKASSGTDPSAVPQNRMAFLAYVLIQNGSTEPTEAEFQYYRSVNTHNANQQTDQIIIYKLNKTNGWSITTRNSSSRIEVGAGLQSSYASNTITLSLDNSTSTMVPNPPTDATKTYVLKCVQGTLIWVEE